jgi:hypothetical protein
VPGCPVHTERAPLTSVAQPTVKTHLTLMRASMAPALGGRAGQPPGRVSCLALATATLRGDWMGLGTSEVMALHP